MKLIVFHYDGKSNDPYFFTESGDKWPKEWVGWHWTYMEDDGGKVTYAKDHSTRRNPPSTTRT